MTFIVRHRFTLLLVGLVVCAMMTGCAGQKGACAWGDRETGLVLEYRMEEGRTLPYRLTNDMTQTMEIMGQSIPVETSEMLAFSVRSKGASGTDFAIEVTIDDLKTTASSPEGSLEADTRAVLGKSFEMTLSRLGAEGGLPDPTSLQYEFASEGPRSVIPGFSAMFADLPDGPVVIGDTWPSSIDISESSGGGDVNITMDVMNTFEGYETVNGRECAHVRGTFTGFVEGSGEQQGVPWSTESEMEGTSDWYFDFKDGVLVKDLTTGMGEGVTVASPPGQTIEIPVTREFVMTTELLK